MLRLSFIDAKLLFLLGLSSDYGKPWRNSIKIR